MYVPDNYNQVTRLSSHNNWLLLLLGLLLSGCLLALLVLPGTALSNLILLVSSGLLALVLLVCIGLRWRQSREPQCRFCHSHLAPVRRALILNNHFLNLGGKKIADDYYLFDRKGVSPYRGQWVKISLISWACHYCKLYESQTRQQYQPVSEREAIDQRLSETAISD